MAGNALTIESAWVGLRKLLSLGEPINFDLDVYPGSSQRQIKPDINKIATMGSLFAKLTKSTDSVTTKILEAEDLLTSFVSVRSSRRRKREAKLSNDMSKKEDSNTLCDAFK